MKGGEWSSYGKMGICEQNAETFIQLRSRIEIILYGLVGFAWLNVLENGMLYDRHDQAI